MDLAQLLGLAQALGFGAYASDLLAVVGIAAILAAVLPPAGGASPKWWRCVRAVLDWCAANKGSAANARAVPGPGSVVNVKQ